jgi:hypothetical protein
MVALLSIAVGVVAYALGYGVGNSKGYWQAFESFKK